MKTKHYNLTISICLLMYALLIFAPLTSSARHNNDEGRYSGYRGSEYSSDINDLDNDVVDDIPIPILFGITLEMVWPNFGDDRDGGARSHEGLDFMAPEGAPIVSPTDAVVIRTGDGDNSGLTVTTANPGSETFVYMHLSEIVVDQGDVLKEGDIIGYVGDTGNAKGGAPHLHFEIRDEDREALDPYERVTLEFSLEEKIEYLEDAIKAVDDEEEFVQFIATTYRTELLQARAAGVELPEEISDQLGVSATTVTTPVAPVATADGGLNRSLQLGSFGADVRALQVFLNTNGFAVAQSGAGSLGNETQTFGPATQAALTQFQLANGISPASGYYGPITQAFVAAYSPLVAASAPAPLTVPISPPSPSTGSAIPARDLQLTTQGEDVRALQTFLISKGFTIEAGATAYFGAQTKNALIEYQKANGITPASGYYGPITRAHMEVNGL